MKDCKSMRKLLTHRTFVSDAILTYFRSTTFRGAVLQDNRMRFLRFFFDTLVVCFSSADYGHIISHMPTTQPYFLRTMTGTIDRLLKMFDRFRNYARRLFQITPVHSSTVLRSRRCLRLIARAIQPNTRQDHHSLRRGAPTFLYLRHMPQIQLPQTLRTNLSTLPAPLPPSDPRRHFRWFGS